MIATEFACSIAAPMPWSTRHAMSTLSEGAMAHRAEPATKIPNP
jgi:hypothetical protein